MIIELPDREFLHAYFRVIEVRLPTEAEKRRYENIINSRKKISKEESDVMLSRLAKYDGAVRINKKKEKIEKQKFSVRLQVDGEEVTWMIYAFSMKEARKMAIDAAKENGAFTVRVLN